MVDNSKKAAALARLRRQGALSNPGEEFIARTLTAEQLEVCAATGAKPSAFTKETASEARARTASAPPAGEEGKIRRLLGIDQAGAQKRRA
jgi:hypothetical protein